VRTTRRSASGKATPPNAAIGAELSKRLEGLAGRSVRVGWFETSKYEDGTPVAYVASIQEFGWGPIPPRPFMRSTEAARKQEWAGVAGKLAKAVVNDKMTPDVAAEQIGQLVSGDIRKTISQIKAPPLALSTLLLRKAKRAGETVGGKKVGEVVRNTQLIGPRAKGDKSLDVRGVPTKPLVFDGILIGTLAYVVEGGSVA
jgi:hypothetical protein